MGVTRSNSGLFSTPGFIVSPVGKRERGGEKKKKKKGRMEKGTKRNRRKVDGIKRIGGKRRRRYFNKS